MKCNETKSDEYQQNLCILFAIVVHVLLPGRRKIQVNVSAQIMHNRAAKNVYFTIPCTYFFFFAAAGPMLKCRMNHLELNDKQSSKAVGEKGQAKPTINDLFALCATIKPDK